MRLLKAARPLPPLLQRSAIYMAFDLLNNVVPFLLLPVMTRYLSPTEYGVLAMFGITQAILSSLVGLNTHGAVAVNFFRMEPADFRLFVGNVLFILGASFVVLSAITTFFLAELSSLTQIPAVWLGLAVVAAAAQFVTLINLTLWQSEENPKAFGTYQFLQTVVNVAVSLVLVVAFGLGVDGRLTALVLTTVAFGGFSVWIIVRRNYAIFRWNRPMVQVALRFGVPLLPHSLSGVIRSGADRFLLTALIGLHATGPYSVAAQMGGVMWLLAFSFNKAYSPYLYRTLTNIDSAGKARLVRYTYAYFGAILVLAVGLGVVSLWVLPFILGPDFAEAAGLVIWISVAHAFDGMYLMVVNYIFFQGRTEVLTLITASGSLLNILLCYWLISEHGVVGAAQAQLITALAIFLAVWAASSRIYRMPWFGAPPT